MKKGIMFLALLLGTVVSAETFGVAESSSVPLDLRARPEELGVPPGTTYAVDYDPLYFANGAASVTLTVGGAVVTSGTAAGQYTLSSSSGTRVISLSDGTETWSRTAVQYPSDGSGNRITSVTAQQRYPWNALVDVTYVMAGAGSAPKVCVRPYAVAGGATNALTNTSGMDSSDAGTHRMTVDLSALKTDVDYTILLQVEPCLPEYCAATEGVLSRCSAVVRLLATPDSAAVAYPAAMEVAYGPAFGQGTTARVLVNGRVLVEAEALGTCSWSAPGVGTYVFTHQTLMNGVVVSTDYEVTREVWAASALVVDGSVPLRELLPTTYGKVTSVRFAEGVAICDGFFDGTTVSSVTYPSTLSGVGYDSLLPSEQAKLSYDASGFMIWNKWLLGYNRPAVTTLTIPNGIVGIGNGALAGLHDLETLKLPASLQYIGERAFEADDYLDNLVLPDAVRSIGRNAFRDCSWLQTVSFGSGLRTVGDGAFSGCTQLASAVFGDSLETLGEEVFSGDWRMLSVALPLSMKSVASSAFSGCQSLTGVTTPSGIAPLKEWFTPVYGQIKDVTVPSGETEVCAGMFADCGSLQQVKLPYGITNIADRAFQNCTALTQVELPKTLGAIGEEAFRGCRALRSAALPEGVVTLGIRAFYDCQRLADVSLSKSLTALPAGVFGACSALDSLYVPVGVTRLGSRFCSSSLRAIYFVGNAPSYAADAYQDTSSSLTTYVNYGTKGWDGRPTSRDLPQYWPPDGSYRRSVATWSPVVYDVTYDAEGGEFPVVRAGTYACEQIVYTSYALPPYEPTRGGYKFDGWWTETQGGTQVTPSTGVKLTKAHTLHAHWVEAAAITVRFTPNGGTVQPNTKVYTAGVPFGSFPVPTREYFAFAGWYTAADGGSRMLESAEAPLADRELFAHWTPITYHIRFHANNGSDETTQQDYIYGQSVTLWANRFSCSGCVFAGWSLAPGGAAVYEDRKQLSNIAAIRNGYVDLYAVWSGKNYAVRFDSNGGVGRMDNQTFVIDVAQPLFANNYTREGYVFKGWAVANDQDASFLDGQSVAGLSTVHGATVVLYAVWQLNPTAYGINFRVDGKAYVATFPACLRGKVYKLPTCTATPPTGRHFAGWRCEQTGRRYDDGMLVFDLAKPGETVVMSAIWE